MKDKFFFVKLISLEYKRSHWICVSYIFKMDVFALHKLYQWLNLQVSHIMRSEPGEEAATAALMDTEVPGLRGSCWPEGAAPGVRTRPARRACSRQVTTPDLELTDSSSMSDDIGSKQNGGSRRQNTSRWDFLYLSKIALVQVPFLLFSN